jgi:hypothetical protein
MSATLCRCSTDSRVKYTREKASLREQLLQFAHGCSLCNAPLLPLKSAHSTRRQQLQHASCAHTAWHLNQLWGTSVTRITAAHAAQAPTCSCASCSCDGACPVLLRSRFALRPAPLPSPPPASSSSPAGAGAGPAAAAAAAAGAMFELASAAAAPSAAAAAAFFSFSFDSLSSRNSSSGIHSVLKELLKGAGAAPATAAAAAAAPGTGGWPPLPLLSCRRFSKMSPH